MTATGTAGRDPQPLQQSGTSFCLITVTRYFGGILPWGPGGLVRPTSAAAASARCQPRESPAHPQPDLSFRLTYPQHDRLRRLLEQAGEGPGEEFTDRVNLWPQVP